MRVNGHVLETGERATIDLAPHPQPSTESTEGGGGGGAGWGGGTEGHPSRRASATSDIGRLTSARAAQLVQQLEQEQHKVVKWQRESKRLKSALKESSAENLRINAQLRAAQREQDIRDAQETAVSEMMKHTLEQLEVSHKEIVAERDMIQLNLVHVLHN